MFTQLLTQSKIFFGHQITLLNRYIDFEDAAGVHAVTLDLGRYTPTELCSEIVRKMNAGSLVDFTVTFNRTTRLFTISGTADFDLLSNSGDNSGSSAFGLLGFDITADYIGAATYTGNAASGSVYSTQFPIQSVKHPDNNRFAIEPVFNKSASGVIEVIKFGDECFFQGEFTFITNEPQATDSVIRANDEGVEDFNTLMQWVTEIGHIELMPDESNVDDFLTLEIAQTDQSQQGLDYDLIELYDKGLPNYFRSGLLRFKNIA